MKKIAFLSGLTALLVASGLSGYAIVKKSDCNPDLANPQEYQIENVIDGDTLKIKYQDGKTDRLRLLSINAPEIDECYGKESKKALEKLIKNQELRFDKDISGLDIYDRLLRYITIISPDPKEDNTLVNYYLVRNGFAFHYSNPPDNRYKDMLISAQREAKKEKLGMWEACDYNKSKEEEDNTNEREKDSGPTDPNCIIKANISEKGYGKTYLIPGCDNYNSVKIDEKKGEAYFCTEKEAQKAGFRKATNCPASE
ncbi:MAG: thermonuclease family protein [Patescibacteria group bacterium]|jgi:micrococcal nuclease|nr:thermonuclease family protein [Patescibacteria group bacterium]